jgi:hypothetical protein
MSSCGRGSCCRGCGHGNCVENCVLVAGVCLYSHPAAERQPEATMAPKANRNDSSEVSHLWWLIRELMELLAAVLPYVVQDFYMA